MNYESIVKEHLSSAAMQNVLRWLNEPKYSEYYDELTHMIEEGRWLELEDAFFQVIEFGTGGRRGVVGVGSNRMNKVTMGESAQALCAYATMADPSAPAKGAVIACDTRLSSPEFSKYIAGVCAANGYKTYLFEDFRATPELSFAVRELGAAIGIVITASHNPPTDNGFKGYWSDGGQLVAPHDKGVLLKAAEIEAIEEIDFDRAIKEEKIILIGEDIDKKYIKAVLAESEGSERDVHIVYSPLHGAGQTSALKVLRSAGFNSMSVVGDQMVPDGRFPTIENGRANPEDKPANDRAVAQMLAEEADVAFTTDPDADRIGVMVRRGSEPIYLDGNQSAVLAADYALRKKKQRGELTAQHYIAKTIVTTDMLNALAKSYGVKLYGNMLIGFKYIGELIHLKEESDEIFLIGGEESYGLLKGGYSRDKDAAVGALLLAEYAAELKLEGKTLYDRLVELYAEHGVYLERLDTVFFRGASGFERMQQVMAGLRENAPKAVGEYTVTAVLDYKSLKKRHLVEEREDTMDCISGNVVVLEFSDERCRITIRPSGTEPKLKFYLQWYEKALEEVEAQKSQLESRLEALSRQLEGLLLE